MEAKVPPFPDPKPAPNKIGTYFQGEEVGSEVESLSGQETSKYLDSLSERVKGGQKVHLIFDLDGTLVATGLTLRPDLMPNKKSFYEWVNNNKNYIDQFKERIKYFHNSGAFKIDVCTGRSFEWGKEFANSLFPDNCLDSIIAEGGAVIALSPKDGQEWEPKPAKSIDSESQRILDKYKLDVIDKVLAINGKVSVEPKRVRLTLNPPAEMATDKFKEFVQKIYQELAGNNLQDKTILETLANNLTQSTPTTIESMPLGVDKLKGLEEVLGNGIAIYFGDEETDQSAMEKSNVNVSPSNASSKIKDYIKGNKENRFIGLQAGEMDIVGVNQSLRTIETYYRRLKRFPKKEEE